MSVFGGITDFVFDRSGWVVITILVKHAECLPSLPL